MSSSDVDERKIGRAVANGMEGQMANLQNSVDSLRRDLANKLDDTNREVNRLNDRIEALERRLTEIEQTKASAQREAMEGLVDDLKEQVDEKRAEFERRRGDILEDYRDSIRRLKDRFVGAISGNREQFEQVEDEFADVGAARTTTADAAGRLGDAPAREYDRRLDAVIESRNGFLTAINDFLDDRETTANTIDSLQTPVPGMSGATTVQVPFWVVGIERDGNEEVRVLPVLSRGSADDAPTRAQPYVNYLREHPTHSYGDMASAVTEYVQRDEVRDRLAGQDGEFADPDCLRRRDETLDRFVDALAEYQLGGTGRSDSIERTAESAEQREVTADA
jgi:archaellum component FlaC